MKTLEKDAKIVNDIALMSLLTDNVEQVNAGCVLFRFLFSWDVYHVNAIQSFNTFNFLSKDFFDSSPSRTPLIFRMRPLQ